MRHFMANLVTYAIAIMLFLGAAVFGWIRSSQYALSDEVTIFARFDPAAVDEPWWAEAGRVGYARNCANCHGMAGGGWDQYPGVHHASVIAATPAGREYLIDLHLYGLTSGRWRAPMPRMAHVGDVELAATLNHIITTYAVAAPPQLFEPPEIAERRGRRLSPREVNERRPPLEPGVERETPAGY
jgi:hypothetical protein